MINSVISGDFYLTFTYIGRVEDKNTHDEHPEGEPAEGQLYILTASLHSHHITTLSPVLSDA